MSSLERPEFFELGDKTSLICTDPSTSDVVKATLKELKFRSHTAETPELTVEGMRYTSYDCIVVHENFAKSSLRSNPSCRCRWRSADIRSSVSSDRLSKHSMRCRRLPRAFI